MLKRITRATIIASLIAVGTGAHAQDTQAPDDLAEPTEAAEPKKTTAEEVEAPPKPEYPYPGSDDPEFASQPKATPVPVEKPLRTDDQGNYYYSTDVQAPTPSGRAGAPQPRSTTRDGAYVYDTAPGPMQHSGRPGVETPLQMTNEGEFHYTTERSPMNAAASFRLGVVTGPEIQQTQFSFSDVYGEDPVPTILGDYEWRLTSKVGRLSLKFGSGISVSSGQGRFVNPANTQKAEEKMTFIVFPNQLTANYKFQYAENQIIAPFVEGGAGYFTFAELRDDNRKPKFGGSLVTVAAGGFNFLLDGLDKRAIRSLDNDYGINHVWLTTEVRIIVGLNKETDFTSQMANAGVLVEF